MKLLLVFAFLALVCLARSAPAPAAPSRERELILPEYADEVVIDEDDSEEDMNSTTTTTTTTTRRSTYTFPTRSRITPSSSRRPWLTDRTSSRKTIVITDEIHDDENKYLKHMRKFFKEMWDDIKSFIRRLTGYDLIKAIQQFFNKKNEED